MLVPKMQAEPFGGFVFAPGNKVAYHLVSVGIEKHRRDFVIVVGFDVALEPKASYCLPRRHGIEEYSQLLESLGRNDLKWIAGQKWYVTGKNGAHRARRVFG